MANRKQLRILTKEGVKAWNEYRKSYRNTKINLRGANLKRQNLEGADFSEADIRSTNFNDANLKGTNFSGAKCGLQRHLAIILLVFNSWLIAGISAAFLPIFWGGFVVLIFDSFDPGYQIGGWISLIVLIFFLIIAIRRGMAVGAFSVAATGGVAFSVAGAFSLEGAFSVALAVVGLVTVAGVSSAALAVAFLVAFLVAGAFSAAFLGAFSVVVAFLVAGAFSVPGAVAEAVAEAVAFSVAEAVAEAVAFSVAGAVAVVVGGAYIGWRAMKGDKRDAWLRSVGIELAAIEGTSFHGADLSDADFTRAKLKSTDFSEATLTGVCWYGAKMLDRVCPGNTYLKNSQLQQWLIGKGTEKKFNSQDLRGVNLQGADLTDVSFIDTDLREANLSETTLTGACIQDWNINSETKLDNVICDYIYLKKGKQERRPSDPNRNFEPSEFAKLVQKSVETVDLIFKDGIDWRAVAYSIKNTQVLNEDTSLAIQSIENKGDGVVLIKVNVPQNADKGKIEGDFWQGYEFANKTLKEQYEARLLDKDKFIDQQGQQINQLFYSLNQAQEKLGEVPKLMAEAGKNEYNFNAPVGSVGNQGTQTNVTGVVEGDQIGTQHNYSSEQQQTLAEAAAEIQKLLQQLEQNNPDATPEQQQAYVNAAIPPSIKQRCASALKAGGETAIEEFLDNPYVNVGKAVVKAWIKPE